MKMPVNWITTLGGLIAGLPVLMASAGIVLPQPILDFLPPLGTLLIGLGAKDSNVTGGTKKNA